MTCTEETILASMERCTFPQTKYGVVLDNVWKLKEKIPAFKILKLLDDDYDRERAFETLAKNDKLSFESKDMVACVGTVSSDSSRLELMKSMGKQAPLVSNQDQQMILSVFESYPAMVEARGMFLPLASEKKEHSKRVMTAREAVITFQSIAHQVTASLNTLNGKCVCQILDFRIPSALCTTSGVVLEVWYEGMANHFEMLLNTPEGWTGFDYVRQGSEVDVCRKKLFEHLTLKKIASIQRREGDDGLYWQSGELFEVSEIDKWHKLPAAVVSETWKSMFADEKK